MVATEGPLVLVKSLAKAQAQNFKPAKSLFVTKHLSDAFFAAGASVLESDELADQWARTFSDLLVAELDKSWRREGVDPPLELSAGAPNVFIGVHHPSFGGALNENVFEILSVIDSCDDHQLNIMGACALAAAEADRIHIVDGANDAGVDVIGLWAKGETMGLCTCIQSKAYADKLAAQHVEQAMDAYLTGTMKPMWNTYRSVLGVDLLPGLARVFVIVSKGGFGETGFDAGRRMGAACIGPRRLAVMISSKFTASELQLRLDRLSGLPRDPKRNLVVYLN